MIIVFLLLLLVLDIYTIHCQLSPSIVISNCSFFPPTYFSHSTVSKQIQFENQTSILLTANYAFLSSTQVSTFELGLIYQFSTTDYLVPFPVIFDCATIVRSCQLKTITGTTSESEAIRVQLTPLNFTTRVITKSIELNFMGLYLKQGRYQLSNCSLNNGEQMTHPQTRFDIQISYEKSVGTSCDPTIDICGSPLLTNCSSSKCTCLSSSTSLVSYSDTFYCADMMTTTNCTIFPSRCITWCNQTRNYLCICPNDTLKIQRNQFFTCELPVNAKNCSNMDTDIRHCPLGQCCFHGQCVDCSTITTTTMTSKAIANPNESLEESLRITLGIIAGLLGTSVLILLSVFAWLRLRQKQRRITTEKSLTNSSTSSLYISPIQQQIKLPYPIFYRANSFRQAVLFGQKFPHLIEHVSTKHDSYPYEINNGWSSRTLTSFDYVLPSQMPPPLNDMEKSNHIYQIILPPTPPILTHAV